MERKGENVLRTVMSEVAATKKEDDRSSQFMSVPLALRKGTASVEFKKALDRVGVQHSRFL